MRSRGAIPSTRIFKSGVAVPKSRVAPVIARSGFGNRGTEKKIMVSDIFGTAHGHGAPGF